MQTNQHQSFQVYRGLQKPLVLKKMASDVIEIPKSHPAVAPLLAVLPLQLLAYHIAVMRNCNVDQPRNLAKSVTVE